MKKIIAIANQKGGVGKTTTAVNLSAALAGQGVKVLMLDMDPQGNATSGAGIILSEDMASSYELLINANDVFETIIPTAIENMSLIPARIDLTAAEIELVPLQNREIRLKNQLDKLTNEFDFVLIDCPPSLGLLTVNALTASDSVLIPLQCEYYAMEGLGQLTDTIRLIREELNPQLSLEGILLTMYDQRNNLSREVSRQIREYFPKDAFTTVIPRNIRLSEAPSYGKPINVYDPKSIGSERYKELALELLERNSDKQLKHKEGR